MLRRGGNAVDAAAAVQFALNVVEPQYSGIGGGGFLMVYLAGRGALHILDGRETAPAAATPDQFLGPDGRPLSPAEAQVRGTAVGVPGTVRQLALALERFGTRSLAETLDFAIGLAEQGVPVSRTVAADIPAHREILAAWPATAAIFLPGGRPLREGETLRQPDLARSFRLLRDRGPAVFYEGEIGRALLAAQAARGGRMTAADLAGYAVKERTPLRGRYRDLALATMPPPSSGGLTLLQMLGLLTPFDLRRDGPDAPRALHLLIEAMRLAHADRARYLADGDFVPVPARGLLAPAYLAERRAHIDPARAHPDPRPGDPFAHEPDTDRAPFTRPMDEGGRHTSHFVVIDGAGNIANFTTTIEGIWGTGITVPGYGFLLNNELTDFDLAPGGPNEVAPGKRPRSNMTPTLAFRDGRAVLALGGSGGARITAAVLQVLLNIVEFGLDVQAAVDRPRVYSAAYPDVRWEAGLPPETLDALRALGHRPEDAPAPVGTVYGAHWDPEAGWTGGADQRRPGTVLHVPSD